MERRFKDIMLKFTAERICSMYMCNHLDDTTGTISKYLVTCMDAYNLAEQTILDDCEYICNWYIIELAILNPANQTVFNLTLRAQVETDIDDEKYCTFSNDMLTAIEDTITGIETGTIAQHHTIVFVL